MDQTSGDLAERDRCGQHTAWRRLALAVVLLLPLAVPLGWLSLELQAARDRALEAIAAGATTVSGTLGDLLHRFERVAAGLRPQDGQGDGAALAARLLRLEPQLSPSSGLLVFDLRGRLVAGSHPLASGGADASATAWFLVALQAQSRAPIVFAPGPNPLGIAGGAVIAQRIDDPHGGAAGVVMTVLPADALRRAAQPEWLAARATIHLSDSSSGYEVLKLAGPDLGISPGWTSRLIAPFLAVLPAFAGTWPATGETDIIPGGLRWEAQLDPLTILNIDIDGFQRRGGWACGIALALAVAALLAGGREAAPARLRHPDPGRPVPALAPAPSQRDGRDAEYERQRAEATLLDVQARLHEGASQGDQVLASIGHSLRTPIVSILGVVALLLDCGLEDSQRHWMLRLRASCEVLLAILNALFDTCSAQAGSPELDAEEVDVADLVREVCDVLEPQAHDMGLELRATVEDTALGVWRTDRTRVRQVLFNLTENAVKYTAHGSVEVRASVVSTQGREVLRVQVADTGPGIEPGERARIFERFQRGHGPMVTTREGIGLGLSVCRDIAILMGGSLTLESTSDAGSVFAFEFPAERVPAVGRHGAPFAGRTALVVGLPEAIRQRVALLLQGLGFAVESASDGFVGLGLAERTATTQGALDLIVVDGALTGLLAETFLLRLRASRPLEGARVVWVASEQAPVPDCASADAVIHHPMEPWDVERVALELLGSASALQAVDPEAPAPVEGRVLLVGDDKMNQTLMAKVLTRAGFSVFTANNGEEAIRAAYRARFDAILIDIQMPGADGIEAICRIRAGETGGARIPIIALTAYNGGVVRRQYLNAGADTVLHKPVNLVRLPVQLREAVTANRAVLPRRGNAEVADASGLDIADEYLEVLVLETGPNRAREYVRAFLADITARVPRIEELLAASEWAAVRRACHDLASVAGTLGAISLADALSLLGDAARDGDATRAGHVMADITAVSVRLRSRMPLCLEAILARHNNSKQGHVA